MAKKSGWKREPARHSLAARGVKTMSAREKGGIVAALTRDAYAYGKGYSNQTWERIAKWLIELGYSPHAAEEILRSKWMRWADDEAGRGAGNRVMTLERFVPFFRKYQPKIDMMLLGEVYGITPEDLPSESELMR